MHPFRDGDTFSTFKNVIEQATNEVNSLDNEYVLKTSQTELEQYFVEKVKIEPLTLHSDKHYIKNQSGVQIDVSHDFMRAVFPGERAVVSGTKIDIAIPFEGNTALWGVRASTFSLSGHPEIEIRNNEIVFNVSFPDDSAEANQDRIRSDIERIIKSLQDAVNYLKNDVNNHNNSAPNIIKQILSYLTWRDSKCAILVFNRTKKSSAIRKKMHEIMGARPEHRKTVLYPPEGNSRYVLVKESDPGREIFITTQLYDIPVKDEK